MRLPSLIEIFCCLSGVGFSFLFQIPWKFFRREEQIIKEREVSLKEASEKEITHLSKRIENLQIKLDQIKDTLHNSCVSDKNCDDRRKLFESKFSYMCKDIENIKKQIAELNLAKRN